MDGWWTVAAGLPMHEVARELVVPTGPLVYVVNAVVRDGPSDVMPAAPRANVVGCEVDLRVEHGIAWERCSMADDQEKSEKANAGHADHHCS